MEESSLAWGWVEEEVLGRISNNSTQHQYYLYHQLPKTNDKMSFKRNF